MENLPTNPEELRDLLLAERAAHTAALTRVQDQNERLRQIIRELQRARFGRHSEKLKISSSLGIDTSTSADRPRKEFAYIIDATGSPDGLRGAIAMCEPRGTIVLKSTVHGEVPVDTAPVIVDELTLVGSRCGRFAPAIALLRSGRVRVDRLIDGQFQLSEATAAFRQAAEKATLKILLKST